VVVSAFLLANLMTKTRMVVPQTRMNDERTKEVPQVLASWTPMLWNGGRYGQDACFSGLSLTFLSDDIALHGVLRKRTAATRAVPRCKVSPEN
jgi:hypothetical protein